jgi:hypothetical protein
MKAEVNGYYKLTNQEGAYSTYYDGVTNPDYCMKVMNFRRENCVKWCIFQKSRGVKAVYGNHNHATLHSSIPRSGWYYFADTMTRVNDEDIRIVRKTLRALGVATPLAESRDSLSKSLPSPSKGIVFGEFSPKKKPERQQVDKIIDKLIASLKQLSVYAFLDLHRSFRTRDDLKKYKLSHMQFTDALSDLHTGLSEDELQILFDNYENGGVANYQLILRTIRSFLPDHRYHWVTDAFDRIVANQRGDIEVEHLLMQYNAAIHPDVIALKSSVHITFRTFSSHFLHSRVRDGPIDKVEFVDFFTNISTMIDDDAYFEDWLRNCFRSSYQPTENERAVKAKHIEEVMVKYCGEDDVTEVQMKNDEYEAFAASTHTPNDATAAGKEIMVQQTLTYPVCLLDAKRGEPDFPPITLPSAKELAGMTYSFFNVILFLIACGSTRS